MNTKRVNAAADVIRRAMENGRKVPAAMAVALESAQMLMSPELAAELEQLREQNAALKAERHSTNDGLAAVTVALREAEATSTPTGLGAWLYEQFVPHANAGSWDGLSKADQAYWEQRAAIVRRAVEEWPLTIYRASHDSIVMGLYTNREAARQHCEANVRLEEPEGSIRHLSWWTEDVADDDAEYELHITPAEVGGLIRGTGYVVTPLDVASAYDEGADE